MASIVERGVTSGARAPTIGMAAYYALGVLALANVLNYLDRQIVSILAQSIKADLKLDDADLGFLLGTAFAVFYSVVGIAMGRISDGLPRKKVMALGLALWSSMTALGGAAASFATLGIARIGVGVGEAVANPCSHSLLADIFPPQRRAIAMSILLSGIFAGGALALFLGGYFLEHWDTMCTGMPIAGACDLAAWKAAMFTVALPGLPLAFMILAIREPVRSTEAQGSKLGFVLGEFATAIPPFTMVTVWRLAGLRGLGWNALIAALLAAAAAILIHLTGDAAQWGAFGLGAYAVVTWGQIQSYRDKPLYRLTFGDRTFLLATISTALVACVGGAVHVWSAPYAMRTFSIPAHELGLSLGVASIAGGVLGVLLGGWATDRWKRSDLRAPIGITAISLLGGVPCILTMLLVKDFTVFIGAAFTLGIFSALWGGATAAMVQDLVLPRMRGSAAASNSLVAIVISSGTGPYWAGKVSALTGSLTAGLLSIMILVPIALYFLWRVSRRLPHETAEARLAIARNAGEPDHA
ncbi:MFS family permease [Novosphingobium chloroacetimidivorans]|uniref:MFS family permease n=1 Tax=Novosphingobium chloroacetimidivorans TaxID=1428314 RepID=A0A7W7NY89_9SPHN|nr:MFS transporter [Novosphingobium chloroacetimidivorans]MBB4860224.1 MFS family permease [Novosphingobium chloroacetimidivorans]